MELSPRLFTVPNIITVGRALAIPWVFLLVMQDPGRHWWIAAAFALTDNIDGMLARLEDKGRTFKSLGFRRSEPGRRLDPVVDKVFITAILLAGMLHGAIPLWLGGLSLAQKIAAAAIALTAEARKIKLHVLRVGKYSEFMTNTGFLLLLAAEAVDSSAQTALQAGAGLLALIGIAIAVLADFGYARKTGLIGTRQ